MLKLDEWWSLISDRFANHWIYNYELGMVWLKWAFRMGWLEFGRNYSWNITW